MVFDRLVWSDEFEYEGPVDPSRWTHDLGFGRNGWGNAEFQEYGDDASVCEVKNGHLTITGRRRGGGYTSARIHTHGKASWTYGRFEVRAKLPGGRGTWPAIWLLGDGIRSGVKWPLCGEIDFVEHVGRDPEMMHVSLHSADYNHVKKNYPTGVHHIPGVLDDFHVYRLDWEEEGFRYFVDGELLSEFPRGDKRTRESWPFDRPYHLIINLALGGHFGGPIDDEALPATLEVDYVRVYG